MKDIHVQAFKEEASELLVELEKSLLELEESPNDSELIATTFRALHTIKGSAGMFGFDNIASFMHEIESVFDLIRNDKIKLSKKIIDLTLLAMDHISLMLNSDGIKNSVESERIVNEFRAILISDKVELHNVPILPSKDEKEKTIINKEVASYKIIFNPHREIFQSGINPLLLINEMKEIGVASLKCLLSDIPTLEEINPEHSYLKWEIELKTDKGIDAIKDVFIFIDDQCDLNISFLENAIDKSDEQIKKNNHENSKRIDNTIGSSIRVHSDKLDELVNLVGELVTVQAQLSQYSLKNNNTDIAQISEEIERITWSLRDSALNIRMLPIGTTFSKFKRLVRDLSNELGKEVEMVTEGAETELDKTVIEKLNDPLIHIIRNCIDHGIEIPEERIKLNKNRVATINLSARQSGGNVLISIKDDGAGLNKEKIVSKAVKQNLISENAELTDAEIYSLIFKPGFSTAGSITNVSGRGVGLDVVKKAIESLRGAIEIQSSPGSGTIITLKLPLTLAIIEGLLVKVGDDHFILPLSYVEECLELTNEDIAKSHGRNIVNLRGTIIPYISLRERFFINSNRPIIEQVVVSNIHNQSIGFVVDQVLGQHQTVLKSLGNYYRNIEGISGATILGDGTVALIIDIEKIAEIEEQISSN